MIDILSYVIDNFQLYYEFNRADIGYGIECKSRVSIVRSADSTIFSEKKDIDPTSVVWKEWNGMKIPILFENEDRELFRIENGRATINFDLIAASFYFLSGWNEYLTKERDKYGRMPYEASMIKKLGIIHLPVVNYYFDLLASVLAEVTVVKKKKLWGDHAFACFLSHDIDKCRSGWKEGIVYSLKKRKLLSILSILFNKIIGKDEFYNFKTILQIEELFLAKSTYFFLRRLVDSGPISNADYEFTEKKNRTARKKIKEAGHEIGIHGSNMSHIDLGILRTDIEALADYEICGNRFHYLRFDPEKSVCVLNNSGIKYDSSLGFAEDIGFRRGTCYPFYLYDFKNMKATTVLELPLTCMDVTLQGEHYLGHSLEQAFDHVASVINEVQKFGGVFTILWHNNYFADRVHPGWKDLYKDILTHCKNAQGAFVSGKGCVDRICKKSAP